MSDYKTKALRQFQHNDCSGLVFGYDIETIDKEFERMEQRIKELESENKMLRFSLSAQPDKATSTGAAQQLMEYEVEKRNKRIKELEQGEKHYSDLWEQVVDANMKHQETIKAMAAEIIKLKGERNEL